MIDPFHLEAYGEKAVNYNRDVEIFPVLSAILTRILGESPYKSPTDMGVNMAGYCLCDDEACCEASKQEIIRRWYHTACEVRKGMASQNALMKLELLMNRLGVTCKDRPPVIPALEKAELNGVHSERSQSARRYPGRRAAPLSGDHPAAAASQGGASRQ